MVLQVVLALGLLALLGVVAAQAVGRPPRREVRPLVGRPGRWQVGHRERDDATWVVVQRVDAASGEVLDEHLVATIDGADPRYEEKFLEAMQAARQRRALFEAEDD